MRIAIHDYAGHPFVFELSRRLARDGHDVRHFYFQGDPGPKGQAQRLDDDVDGFGIEPVAISAPYRKDQLLRRRAQDLEYGRTAGARIAAFKPDVVLSGNTPLQAQALVLAAARRAGAAFVFWMQDFYSLAVKDLLGRKFLGAGALAGFWYERLEATLLSRSDAVVSISDDFTDGLESLRIAKERVDIIPNWGAISAIPERPKDNTWSASMALSNSFVFLYSGTLGLKHDPMLLCALADAFAHDASVRIVVSAAGAGYELLKLEQSASRRANLILNGLQPIEALPDMLATADVFVGLLEKEAGRYSVPSKVLSYLCAGKPTLLCAPLENLSARVLRDANGGITVAAGDVLEMVAAAARLRLDSQARDDMGRSARRYAEANFDLRNVADRFQDVFSRALMRRDERVLVRAA